MGNGFGDRAAAAMVHTAVTGIALACIPDADARLTGLLTAAIDDLESLVRVTPQPARSLVAV